MTLGDAAAPAKIHKNKLFPPNPNGRPEKVIDWDKVEHLLKAGCLGTEVAAYFDMNPKTFYLKVEAKYNMSFTAFCQQRECHGNALIRNKQFEKAIEGDNTCLIWLGKNRLKQSDNPVQDAISQESMVKVDAVLKQLNDLRMAQSERKIEDNNIINEAKS
jgi:AraC-like DNA-binding protein